MQSMLTCMLPTEEVRMPVPLKSDTHTIFSTPLDASIAAMACSRIHTRYLSCRYRTRTPPTAHAHSVKRVSHCGRQGLMRRV
jgi:hypothetical protein